MVINKLKDKFILEFTLDGNINYNYGLEITIIHWNHNFFWDDINEFNQFYFEDKGFMLYSFENGEIFENIFVIPEKHSLTNEHKLNYNFATDVDRYTYLKRLYNCLNLWGKTWKGFTKHNLQSDKDISMHNKFWTL